MKNKTVSKTKLKKIYNREFKFLEDSIKNSKNPYHCFYLSSKHQEFPEIRTIVLRGVKKSKSVFFNADFRSPKVKQLLLDNKCVALFYDNKRRIQLRMKCTANINHQNKISELIWKNTPLQSRKCYMGPYAPSKNIDIYHPNIPPEYLKKDPNKGDSEKGYLNFCHIELSILFIDILSLHHDGHIRFNLDTKTNVFNYIAP